MKQLSIVAVAALAGTAALAQTPASPPAAPAPAAPMAQPMRDKVMMRTEVVQMVRDHFGRMDADRNGAITTTELDQMRANFVDGAKPRRFEHRLDGPARDPNAAFDRLDANKDGSISRDEFAKAREERIERRVERIEKRKESTPKDGKQVRRFVHGTGGFGGRMIVMADSNKDGQITLAEAESMALQHFDQIDSNKDGQVTREERRTKRDVLIKRSLEEKSGS